MPRIYCLLFLALLSLACQEQVEPQRDLYEVIPSQALAIAEINDFEALRSQLENSKVYQDLQGIPALPLLERQLSYYFQGVPADTLKPFLQSRRLVASLHRSGARGYDWLVVTSRDPVLEKVLSTDLQERGAKLKRHSYGGVEIYSLENASQSPTTAPIHLATLEGGLLLASSKRGLVEEAIRQSQSPAHLRQNANFAKLLRTRGEDIPVNLFFHLQESEELLQKLFPQGEFQQISALGSWAQADLQLSQSTLFLSGLLLVPEQESSYLQSFTTIDTHEPQSPSIVPANPGFWLHLNIGNAPQYYRNYEDYLRQNGRLELHRSLLERIEGKPTEALLSWVDHEMGIFHNGREEGSSSVLAYLRHRQKPEEVRNTLKVFSDSNHVQGYRGKLIHKLQATNLLPRVWGPLFQDFHHPYYIILPHYVLFSESEAALKLTLNDIMAGKVLKESDSYRSMQQKLPGRAHLHLLGHHPEGQALLQELTGAKEELDQNSPLQNLGWAALQLQVKKEGVFLTAALQHRPPSREKVVRQWSVQLPEQPLQEPQLVKNHRSGGYDIVVQTENHQLYLISHEGNIRWKKDLEGPILGPIHQADRYRNDHYQLVFNTAQKIHMIDLLGRSVEGFPVALPQKATAPMGVFDYDEARNYRLVVPTGKQLRNYDIEGQPVQGWEFSPASSPLISRPQHFAVQEKDLIVLRSKEGKLHLLNRRGQPRFQIEQKVEELRGPFYLRPGSSLRQSELLAHSNSGKLYVIHPTGSIDALFLEPSLPADQYSYLAGHHLFSHRRKLLVKHPQNPFQTSFPEPISHAPKIYLRQDKLYVGAYSEKAQEIRIYDRKGQLIPGFPVFAQAPFDMGSLRRNSVINVVTSSRDGTLICYALR